MSSLMAMLVIPGLLAWLGTAWVHCYAERLRLVRVPNHRSSHIRPTPNGGGLGIVVGGAIAGTWVAWAGGTVLWVVLGLSLFVAGVGLWNDVRDLPAWTRFGVQVAACGGLLIALGAMPDVTLIPASLPEGGRMVVAGWVLSALLLLTAVWWINLFNFMDGIDGIAGSQAVFMLVVGVGLAACGHPDVVAEPAWIWMLCVAAATVGFLLLNWPPAKVFMGDVGSTYLAFMIFTFALLSVQADWMSYVAWLVLAAVFVADATVTLLTRMVRGERWYEAHRSHVYQRLARRWGGHRSVTLLTIALNVLWLAPLAWACQAGPQWAFGFAALGYAPLVAGAVALGAGRPDDA